MSERPFIVQRPPFFTVAQLERIEEAMLRILEQAGIAILDDEILNQLRSCGFQSRDNRVFVERKLVSEFLDAERKKNEYKFSEDSRPVEPSSHEIHVHVIEYAQWIHDIEKDEIVRLDTEKLIEATKLLDVLSVSGHAGYPTDVPPPLQPVVQYWVSALYSRCARHRVDAKSLETLPYIMEMGAALGDPLRYLPVYVFSPLTLGSESLKCVLEFRDRISSVGVGNMPSIGCTTPINLGDAFALSAAEVIGAAILLKEIVDDVTTLVHENSNISYILENSLPLFIDHAESNQLLLDSTNGYSIGGTVRADKLFKLFPLLARDGLDPYPHLFAK